MKMNVSRTQVDVWTNLSERDAMQAYQQVVDQARPNEMCCDPRWFVAVCRGLKHQPHLLVASQGGQPVGVLPLAFVKSRLFGRFLVSLPYINSAGVIAEDNEIATALIDRAVELADDLDVRHLELRHERPVEHPALGGEITNKVLMRLPLPDSSKELWDGLKAKVRNKVRKGEKQGFTIHWGSQDLLADFYAVFSRNMRDLGTPVFGERLFLAILTQFQNEAELCVVRAGRQPIAAGLLVHGDGATEVPSASSLRDFNSTNANDLMYWHLLQRAVERGQRLFDFGRSTVDGNTFVFKKKWGARPEPTVWQYYTRKGAAADFRPDSGKYDRMIAAWRRLPVWATRLIGPSIIRGIP